MMGSLVNPDHSILNIIPPSVLANVESLRFDLSGWQGNPRIGDVLSRSVLTGGKRIRPLMTFLVADLFGVDAQKVAPYAQVVELVHASTLAHDDVIDNATTRRGKPSINAVTSNKQAVLAGDYLLAHVLNQVASGGRNDIVQELAHVIGDLAEGEWLQIENSRADELQWDDIERVALKKTGSVMRWCAVVPPLLAHASDRSVRLAKAFGETVGVAFQLSDDILDFKRRDGMEHQDLKNGVVNAVLYEMNWAPHRGSDLDLEEAIGKVRARLDGMLNEAKATLAEILEELPMPDHGQREAYRSLNHLVDYLRDRI